MHKPRHFALLLAVFCSLTGLAAPAHAYLDPSTGSMILSAVVGLFATLGLAVKTYWYKLKNLITGRPPTPPQAGGHPPKPAADGAQAEANATPQAKSSTSRSSQSS